MSDGNDTFTTVTETSWFSRLGSSFGGIGAGLVLFVIATVLLYWNEGRAVRTGDAIAEAQMAAEPMPSITKIDPAFEGKMVFATGKAVTSDELTDSIFGIKTKAVRLSRRVEYYQWVEESRQEKRTKMGGGEETVTTYSYKQAWVSSPVDSQGFQRPEGHENTVRIQVEDEQQYAQNVTFGAYRLPDFFIRSISGEKALNLSLSDADRARLQRDFFDPRGMNGQASGNAFGDAGYDKSGYAQNGSAGPASMIHSQGNTIYVGRQPSAPRVGDARVSFFEVKPAEISLLAKVSGDTFVQFRASNGQAFSRLSMGVRDMNGMFEDAKSANDTLTMVLRIVGVILCIVALRMVVAPIRIVADVIPLLGSIVGAGTGLVAILLGAAWSCIIIAVAWIRFRPVLGCILLAAAVVLIGFLYMRGRSRKSQAA